MDLKKSITKKMILAYILTFAFIAGIPSIIFGATKGWTLLLIVGIICVVAGFYGMPIAWISFSDKKKLYNIYQSITVDKIYDIKTLAGNYNIDEQQMLGYVNTLLSNRYLQGLNLVDQKELQEIKKAKKKMQVVKCPNCNANIGDLVSSGEDTVECPYCKATITL